MKKGSKASEVTKSKMKAAQLKRRIKDMEETSYKEIADEGFKHATEDLYVSTKGDVIRVKEYEGKVYYQLLIPSTTKDGYKQVSSTARKGAIHIHTLVMMTYVGPRPDGMEINHIDENKANNRLENLEYVTHKENMAKCNQKVPHKYYGRYYIKTETYRDEEGRSIHMNPVNYWQWLKSIGRTRLARRFYRENKEILENYFKF